MSTQRLFRIYLGSEIEASRRQYGLEIVDTVKATEIVAKHFPKGFTVLQGLGHYLPTDRPLVRESTTIFEILGEYTDAPQVRTLAEELKREFRQDSVILTVSDIFFDFI